MRLTCPCCGKRFDVPHRTVLAEAERLRPARPVSAPTRPIGPDVDGNTLNASDPAALKARQEAIRRRLKKD